MIGDDGTCCEKLKCSDFRPLLLGIKYTNYDDDKKEIKQFYENDFQCGDGGSGFSKKRFVTGNDLFFKKLKVAIDGGVFKETKEDEIQDELLNSAKEKCCAPKKCKR